MPRETIYMSAQINCAIRRKQIVFAQEDRAECQDCMLLFYWRMQSEGSKGVGERKVRQGRQEKFQSGA